MKRIQLAIAAALVAGTMAVDVVPGEAHKPITSPYTYNDDVFPLLRDKCGRCHVSGGVAPMSLMTHADAVPWGESIRTEVLAGHMPPGGIDSAAGRFRDVSALSPREMNVLLTWVTGGTPLGSPEKNPTPIAYEDVWRLGSPDLALPLPTEFTIAADAREQIAEFVVATGVSERRWVRAVDLKPGNPTMVRAATIAVRSSSPSDMKTERMLAAWLPGHDPMPLDEGVVFELPAGAELAVRVLYRKTWEFERKELRDRSTVGVYFANKPGRAVQALSLTPGQPVTLAEDTIGLAIYPQSGLENANAQVTAVRPNGIRRELISLHPRPDWVRRYWFKDPIVLPRGTRLEVTTALDDEAVLPLSVAPSASKPIDPSTLRLILNVTTRP